MGKDLLERGSIEKRGTLVPLTLNKIHVFKLSADVRPTYFLSLRSLMADGNRTARNTSCQARCGPLSIVGYPHEVAKVIAFVFSDM